MTLAFTVLQIVAPVFILASIGFAWVTLKYAYDTAFVTRLTMTLAVPVRSSSPCRAGAWTRARQGA